MPPITLQNNGQVEFDIDPVGALGEDEPDTNALTASVVQTDLLKVVLSPDNKKLGLVGQGKDGVANVTLDDGRGATSTFEVDLVDPAAVAFKLQNESTVVTAGTPFSWEAGAAATSQPAVAS